MVTLKLTEAQLRVLLNVAGEGFGDGDVFGANDDPPFDSHPKGRRDALTWNRCLDSIQKQTGQQLGFMMCHGLEASDERD